MKRKSRKAELAVNFREITVAAVRTMRIRAGGKPVFNRLNFLSKLEKTEK
jgi:hypothetical protein